MSRPKLLDLFCGAGGASVGYDRAGFDVLGVDLHPQRRYPFPFLQADVSSLRPEFLRYFDVIHASPPCQFATAMNNDKTRHTDFIPLTRWLLKRSGVPYVIENVMQASRHLHEPITLCGTMFGLGVEGCENQRHRAFECSHPISAPCGCRHSGGPVVGVYGGHARKRSAKHGGRKTRDVWQGGHKVAAAEAMGIDWMTLGEMSESIPPAYSEHIGRQLTDLLWL